jgi:hypothetical protein
MQSLKKCVMYTLFVRKLKIFFTNLGHVILSKVMTFEIKVFGKIEVYDGLYNCLLRVVMDENTLRWNIFWHMWNPY